MNEALSSANQRATILSAAIDILRQGGPNNLTVRRVATAAGCSTTGVYTWFGGKNELVDAIMVDGFDSFREALSSANAAPGLDSLVALGVAYRRWAHAHAIEYQVMFTRAVPEHSASEVAQTAALKAFEVLVDEVEANRSAARLGDVDTELFACHFWATVHGHVMLDIYGLGVEAHKTQQDPSSPDMQYVKSLTAAIRGFQTSRDRPTS